MDNTIDKKAADNIRVLAASMVEQAQSGHPGGPMGGADFMHILYSEFLRFDPDNPNWRFRDRFFMDAGHLSTLMYAQYHLLGKYTKEDLMNFRQWSSVTPGHPELDVERGIENTSGPLGQGHTMGVGAAIAAKFFRARFGNWVDHNIYAFISDGGIQEEISQGAGRIAGHLGLNNLIMFYDSNDVQLSTSTDEVTSEDTAKKYEAWGWRVKTIDAHDHEEIRQALREANEEQEKPFLIIGKTVMGKGCVDANGNSYEGHCELHGMPLSQTGAYYNTTILNLGGNPEDPFGIYPEVQAYYKTILEAKQKESKAIQSEEKKWQSANPTQAVKLDQFFSGQMEVLDFSSIVQNKNQSTRAASSKVLAYLAENVENMIVASVDLSNSDKTDGFLKKTSVIQRGNYGGNFLQAGVAELTMAALANGMALHGGVIPVVATFFVFSDYMKPAIRMAAIQELPVKYIWTHDAFRVGEDGPTHQPIEQEAQLRLLEKLKNHAGKNSLLALRPADSAETTVAWQMALENMSTPTGLILSRQNITDIPPERDRFQEAQEAKKGGYLVRQAEQPDVVLVANGSEVATLMAGADLLEQREGLKVSIASVISEGLFRQQSSAYQKSVIPEHVPVLGLTAGLPVTLEGLVGPKGEVFGLDQFGYSAPASVLDQKFGFTADNVCNLVITLLKKQTCLI